MIGIRDLDGSERERLTLSGVHVYTMRDVDELGMATVARRAFSHLNHLPQIHVSLDMDSIDPDVAPGVGTPVPGGLTFREAHLLMEILANRAKSARSTSSRSTQSSTTATGRRSWRWSWWLRCWGSVFCKR